MAISLKELVDVIGCGIEQVYRPRNFNKKFYTVTNIIYNTDSKFRDDVGGLAIVTKDNHIFSVIVAKIK